MNIDALKKTLECCFNPTLNYCTDCPYNNDKQWLDCDMDKMHQDALNLINELESENKRLKKDCADIANDYQEMGKFYNEEVEKNQQLNDLIAELKSENELSKNTKQEQKIVYGSLITSTKCYNCIHFPLCFAQKGGANLELASDCCYYQPKLPTNNVVLSKEQKQ